MNTINPLPAAFSPAAVSRSSGASSLAGPAQVAATTQGASSTSAQAQAQALQGASTSAEATESGKARGREDAETLQRELDAVMKDVQTSLRFRVDDDANRVVVSVVDQGSGDVIYQIPSDVSLRIAKRMAELGSGMIDESA